MKISLSPPRNHGLTLLETVVVVLVLGVVVAMLFPALAPPRRKGGPNCINNLKQTGLSFRIWEDDNNDHDPMFVSVTNGGAMEAAAQGDAVTVFQVMSNELSTPKILICPQDSIKAATNFGPALTARNVSYFINIDRTESRPQEILSGDDNFEINRQPVKPGLLMVFSNTPIAWSAKRHNLNGNLMLADGSVQAMSNPDLIHWLRSTNSPALRLAIP